MVPENLDLRYLLTAASDVIERVANDLGIELDEPVPHASDSAARGIRSNKIANYGPNLAQYGGEFFRFAIAPSEQLQVMMKALKKLRLEKSTTVLPCVSSLGSYIVCDGLQVGLSSTLSSLCRPTPQTLQLAERLRSRIDIDWHPVASLFEIIDDHRRQQSSDSQAPLFPSAPLSLSGTLPASGSEA